MSQLIQIVPFERYPEGDSWIKTSAVISSENGLFNFYVPNTNIIINDVISGKPSTQYQFNASIPAATKSVPNPMRPDPFKYVIYPKQINPAPPYTLSLLIFVQRSAPGSLSSASNEWFVPVLGVIENEVPNYYPVATDPNLIFLVLRYPPGKYTIHVTVSTILRH